MKKITLKAILIVSILFIVLGAFKISDNYIQNVNASTNEIADACGINNGIIWNGNSCVRVCDDYHPWNPNTKNCSTPNDYYINQNYYTNTNCANVYGSNYYYNGKNCVEITTKTNVNYYGNPYNGGTQTPSYTYNNNNANNIINNNYYINNYNTNNNTPTWLNCAECNTNTTFVNTYCNSCNSYYDGPSRNTVYYIEITTTTISQPKGNPIWYSANNTNYYNNVNYYDYIPGPYWSNGVYYVY